MDSAKMENRKWFEVVDDIESGTPGEQEVSEDLHSDNLYTLTELQQRKKLFFIPRLYIHYGYRAHPNFTV